MLLGTVFVYCRSYCYPLRSVRTQSRSSYNAYWTTWSTLRDHVRKVLHSWYRLEFTGTLKVRRFHESVSWSGEVWYIFLSQIVRFGFFIILATTAGCCSYVTRGVIPGLHDQGVPPETLQRYPVKLPLPS